MTLARTRWWIVVGMLAALAGGSWSVRAEQSPQALFERARLMEENGKTVKDAIALYKQVADQAGPNRALAAQALLRAAECYEKLGDGQARGLYEQIVREYGDQAAPAAVAKIRLGSASAARQQGEVAPRRVWNQTNQVAVSPDGRYMAHAGSRSDSLILRDLTTGAERPLTGAPPPGSRIFWSAFSADGTELAYNRCIELIDCELRVVPVHGTGVPASRRVYANADMYPIPADWSPDGKWIAVNLRLHDRTGTQIALIGTSDGVVRQLKTVDWGSVPRIVFSPDGRDVAVSLQSETTENDVFLLAIDGTSQVPVVTLPGDDSPIDWTPDGRYLLFINRSRGGDVWAQSIVERKPQGSPKLVKLGIGGGSTVGFTRSGDLYVGTIRAGWNIEIASIDPDTGKQTTPSVEPIVRGDGFATQPTWSPDGKSLGYVFNPSSGRAVVGIQSTETGAVRELHLQPALGNVLALTWAPDGGSLLVWGRDSRGRDGVFRVALTGDVVPIVVPGPSEMHMGIYSSPDGKRLYYLSRKDGSVYERDLASGNERVVVSGSPEIAVGRTQAISLSPDGRFIAVSGLGAATKSPSVVLVPVAGGKPRELLRGTEPEQLSPTTWTPDGQAVLVLKLLNQDASAKELWIVPTDGAAPRQLEFDASRLSVDLYGRIRLHPDGKRLAFVVGAVQKEVWVLENLLSGLR